MANYVNSVEKGAKTVDEAIREALAALKATADEAAIEVLDEGSKGFLSIGSRPARVRATLRHDPVRVAKGFITDVTLSSGIKAEIEAELKEKFLYVNMKGAGLGVLIGKRGQTLDALQYLLSLAVNRDGDAYVSVTLDAEDYRKRRRETLESLAYNLAKKVKTTKGSVVLEPMSPNERRIIHAALQNDRYVTTNSEGEEPGRHIVIAYKGEGAKQSRGEGGPRHSDSARPGTPGSKPSGGRSGKSFRGPRSQAYTGRSGSGARSYEKREY